MKTRTLADMVKQCHKIHQITLLWKELSKTINSMALVFPTWIKRVSNGTKENGKIMIGLALEQQDVLALSGQMNAIVTECLLKERIGYQKNKLTIKMGSL